MKLSLALLAGGLGKRLGDKTKDNPKALIDVAGKPFIYRQLTYLKDQGFENILICTAYHGEKIKRYIGNGSQFNLNISYSDDGNEVLGTGGSIQKACQFLDQNFFILYGDSFLPINFSLVEKAFFEEKKPALMTVMKNSGQWDVSNAYFKNRCVYYNKKNPKNDMDYIDYGLSIVNNSIFDNFEKDKNFDLADVFMFLSQKNLLAGFEAKVRFYEIDSTSGLNDTINFFKKMKEK